MQFKKRGYLGFAFSTFSTLFALGQNAAYDTRLTLKNADCKARKLEIGVEVKALRAETAFYMGDANYRFEYNALQLKSPKIISQDNFSSVMNKNYGQQNLQGSRELSERGIVSLNVFYTASNSGAQKLLDKWQSVATIGFELRDFKNPVALRLNDTKTFPISGMSAVHITEPNPAEFEYEFQEARAGGSNGQLLFDPKKTCPSNLPFVESLKLRVQKNKTLSIKLPIYDSDIDDVHSAKVSSPENGKALLDIEKLVNNRSIEILYTPKENFIGKDNIALSVSDKYGNVSTATIQVTVAENGLLIHNAVSPNEDGKNDFFVVEGLENTAKHKLSIFDRAGKIIYSSENYKNDWNGRFNGTSLPDGTYFYILEADEEVVKSYLEIVN
jgi:gliding motility-associated-like protein